MVPDVRSTWSVYLHCGRTPPCTAQSASASSPSPSSSPSSLSLYLLRSLHAPLCNCDVCASYLSSSWSSQFDNLCDWYTHLLQNSPTGTIHVHVLRNTITANPSNVEHILLARFDNYPKGKPFNAILGDLLGRGIFNADGDSWRFQRKMASLELGLESRTGSPVGKLPDWLPFRPRPFPVCPCSLVMLCFSFPPEALSSATVSLLPLSPCSALFFFTLLLPGGPFVRPSWCGL